MSPPAASVAHPHSEPDDRPQIWGGVECTVNRVRDRYFSQLDRSGHLTRDDDLDRFASLGIKAIRYPMLWEQMAPREHDSVEWSWLDGRLEGLRRLGIAPIAGLVHHGSGPAHTHLLDPGFAPALARYAGALAERHPWVEDWTPVNEPLTTARFSCLYGVWFPHARNDRAFVTALLNECRATVLTMREVRKINPQSRLVQTDDLCSTHGTEPMKSRVEFYNHRRWLAWDLLCGRVERAHPLWRYLMDHGATPRDVLWFRDNPCPPDVLGVNHYVTSDRWLDHRVDRYPLRCRDVRSKDAFVDIEAVRVQGAPALRLSGLLREAWERYGIPVAITEAHIDATREDQLRWLDGVWREARDARRAGVDVRAVTVWSLLGAFDWNCLLSECRGYYEPGPFDIRAPLPRPTALAALVKELAAGKAPSHPVLRGEGWWRRPDRFIAEATARADVVTAIALYRHFRDGGAARPILVSGATGTLGRAFAKVCERRNLSVKLVGRHVMDIAEPASVAAALERFQPWAVINASGYVRIDDAETDAERCFRENEAGPRVLAEACARTGTRLLTFSSDQVFAGASDSPCRESDPTGPVNVYGRSKAAAERAVLAACSTAMVVRTSAFFGPWDEHNFVVRALAALEAGEPFRADAETRVSPTFVPDLVGVCLDLLVDGESGLWHLANDGDVSWHELARRAADLAGVDAGALQPVTTAELGQAARRPRHAVLASERASLMPTLDDALARFVAAWRDARPARSSAPERSARVGR